MLEPVTVITGLQYVAVMGQPVQQGGSHFFITEHRGPFGKAEVGGDDDAGTLIQLADQVEQQGATGLAEG